MWVLPFFISTVRLFISHLSLHLPKQNLTTSKSKAANKILIQILHDGHYSHLPCSSTDIVSILIYSIKNDACKHFIHHLSFFAEKRCESPIIWFENKADLQVKLGVGKISFNFHQRINWSCSLTSLYACLTSERVVIEKKSNATKLKETP